MGTAMFYSPIYTILLVVIHSSKNKTEKVDGFAVIFDQGGGHSKYILYSDLRPQSR